MVKSNNDTVSVSDYRFMIFVTISFVTADLSNNILQLNLTFKTKTDYFLKLYNGSMQMIQYMLFQEIEYR